MDFETFLKSHHKKGETIFGYLKKLGGKVEVRGYKREENDAWRISIEYDGTVSEQDLAVGEFFLSLMKDPLFKNVELDRLSTCIECGIMERNYNFFYHRDVDPVRVTCTDTQCTCRTGTMVQRVISP